MTARQQKWAEARMAEGKCSTCGRPRENHNSRVYCERCLAQRRARKRNRKPALHALSDPEPVASRVVPVAPSELDQDSEEAYSPAPAAHCALCSIIEGTNAPCTREHQEMGPNQETEKWEQLPPRPSQDEARELEREFDEVTQDAGLEALERQADVERYERENE